MLNFFKKIIKIYFDIFLSKKYFKKQSLPISQTPPNSFQQIFKFKKLK
jgi:hypothetical protein